MAETADDDDGGVPLIRCPSCQKLLPEITHFSVYECGNCGAVLQAKNKGVDLDAFPVNSNSDVDSIRTGGTEAASSEKRLVSVSERIRKIEMSDGDSEAESDKMMTMMMMRRPSIGAGTRVVVHDNNNGGGGATATLRSSSSSSGEEERLGDGDAEVISRDRRRSVAVELERAKMHPAWGPEENELGGPGRRGRNDRRGQAEGFVRSRRGGRNAAAGEEDMLPFDAGPRVGFGQDGAQLLNLKQLEVRKDSNNSIGIEQAKQEMRVAPRIMDEEEEDHDHDPYKVYAAAAAASSSSSSSSMKQQQGETMWITHRQNSYHHQNQYQYHHQYQYQYQYQHQYAEPPCPAGFDPPPPSHGWGGLSRRSYMPMPLPHVVYHQAHTLPPPPPPHPHSHRRRTGSAGSGPPYQNDTEEEGGDEDNTVLVEPYPVNYSHTHTHTHARRHHHHPSCPCYQCLSQRLLLPAAPPILPTAYTNHNYSDMLAYNHNSRHHNPRFSDHPPSLKSHHSQSSQARWPSVVDSEVSGYIHHRRRPRGGNHCSPIAGGAPFLMCYKCSELLLLSRKVLTKNINKVRCGACSTLIVLALSKKTLAAVSSNGLPADQNGPIQVNKIKPAAGHVMATSVDAPHTTFSSDGYDSFLRMDRDSGHSVYKSMQDVKPHRSTTSNSYASETEGDKDKRWDCLAGAEIKKDSSLADHSTESKGQPPFSGPSLQDYFEHSNKYHAVDPPPNEQSLLSDHSEHEKRLGNKTSTTRQISRKESSATEIDLSSNEFNSTGTTLDSGEASRGRGNDLKAGRAAKSFFAGIVEESFKDSDRFNEGVEQELGRASVTVNGHLIPDRLIKKAQKLAGPISPGNYWYDCRAGFWGAIGGPCLGIIPPFIEEFNYPMPERCSGGKGTAVYVNGRELNERELNLLGGRGLPKERERSYIIEISGRVLDEATGEELQGLGKLAPTVERMKRGFGMRELAPQAAV
ncbi:uncharacterized protein LOC127246184 isoform X2 [Andrographis paniculata]|uniref:uncharacterized protein LOC127246184 isoform X2 n=1 Tax=Andrographis paniculata TaxID=175694 RepID=UPI0021E8C81B|nr:uncharacterized protein LOC127246184 isoform X2 [Andrographis paniculata]